MPLILTYYNIKYMTKIRFGIGNLSQNLNVIIKLFIGCVKVILQKNVYFCLGPKYETLFCLEN